MSAVHEPHRQHRAEALARKLADLDGVDPDQRVLETRSVLANGPLVIVGDPVPAWLTYAHRASEIISFIESGGLRCKPEKLTTGV